MEETSNDTFVGNILEKRQLDRLMCGREDNIKIGLREICVKI
jgi:hypothetical protein